jgi:hypothetical protein
MLVVVEAIRRKDHGCSMYHLACKASVLDTLYHPSYMMAVSSTSAVLGSEDVIDEWIKKLQHLCPWLASKEYILDVGAKVAHAILEGVHALTELKCNSTCHGGIKKYVIKDLFSEENYMCNRSIN